METATEKTEPKPHGNTNRRIIGTKDAMAPVILSQILPDDGKYPPMIREDLLDEVAKSSFNRIFPTPRHLYNAVMGYFIGCQTSLEPPTITGVCLAIGISTRGFVRYKKKGDGYDSVIKWAKMVCENFLENKLATGTGHPVGSIFILKNNYGWKDQQEITTTTKMLIVNSETDFEDDDYEDDE